MGITVTVPPQISDSDFLSTVCPQTCLAAGIIDPTCDPNFNASAVNGQLSPPSPLEVATLRELYRAMDGSQWANNNNWLEERDVCSWYGVTCSTSTPGVRRLELGGNSLTGTIPTEVGLLTSMTHFQIYTNST